MVIDLHHIAGRVGNPDAPGRFLGPHTAAGLQVVIVLLGSITRFYFNMMRPLENTDPDLGQSQRLPFRQSYGSYAAAVVCGVGATVLWVLTTWNLMDEVGEPTDLTGRPREDATVVWLVSLVQVGYPVVFFLEIYWLLAVSKDLNDVADQTLPKKSWRMMPGNQMDPGFSLFKDVAYGFLDVTSKGGLALYCGLRAAQ